MLFLFISVGSYMTTYVVGDTHGCSGTLAALVDQLNPSDNDSFVFLGDYVNKGPDSAGVIRLVKSLPRVRYVLGNHDLHCLASHYGLQRGSDRQSGFRQISLQKDADDLLDWLKRGEICYVDHRQKFIAVHAGIWPEWTLSDCESINSQIHKFGWDKILSHSTHYAGAGQSFSPTLDWLRDAISICVGMRYMKTSGLLEWGTIAAPPQPGLIPWYDWPRKIDCHIYFGHWAYLSGLSRPGFTHLDGGIAYQKSLLACAHETKQHYQLNYRK